jgi:plastocyanin
MAERVKIKAKNFAFDVSTITVPAGSRVIVEFENEDGVPHNVAFYTSPSLSATIYQGEIVTGPRTITYTFTAPVTPGNYYFRCDVHPEMDGQFIAT